jgi:signal transduction histidine kinase
MLTQGLQTLGKSRYDGCTYFLHLALNFLLRTLSYGFAAAIAFLPTTAIAVSLQGNWQTFYQQAWEEAKVEVTQQELNRFPKILLLSDSLYPDFHSFSWKEVRALWQVQSLCQPIAADSQQKLIEAAEFELSLCQQQPLSELWFSRHSLRHPAGKSYADRYVDHFKLRQIPSYLADRFTLDNPLHPLHSRLNVLSAAGKDALLGGYRAYLEHDVLWLSAEEGWRSLPANQWQPLAEQLSLSMNAEDKGCSFRYSNLCINEHANNTFLAQLAILVTFPLLLMALARSGYLRHQQNREKRFILQLLTHELRTPITSLGLTVEMFREEYDNLNPPTQHALWRLVSDHQRLTQLTDASKDYLSAQKALPFQKQSADIKDWLEYICDKHSVVFHLNQHKELDLPYYWLSLCLDNLLRNACQHGKGEVVVKVEISTRLRIQVCDNGTFPSRLAWLVRSFRPKTRTDNMGIGLNIVAHLMKQMGGRLIILRKPTRCILELPL